MKRIIFGLGSNLGDKEEYLDIAVKELKKELSLLKIRRSSIFKNPAMLLPDSPSEWNQEFFNIAVSADIDIETFNPEKILEIVKKIEHKIGRKDRQRWAPREIDIDILMIEDLKVCIADKLIIPHYDLTNRDFFIKTIDEIEEGWKQYL